MLVGMPAGATAEVVDGTIARVVLLDKWEHPNKARS